MEKYRCKLCFRNFANGRALGGHMRSHMMNLYTAKKRLNLEEEDDEKEEKFFDKDFHSYSSTSSSSSEEENDEEEDEEEMKRVLSYGSRENPKRLADPESDSAVVQDRESETESSEKKKKNDNNNPVLRRRSKRVRKSDSTRFFSMKDFILVKKSKLDEYLEHEPVSSISETTPEEDVAHCLIMLSKDKWKREEKEKKFEEDDDFCEDSPKVMVKSRVRGKYRCETCNKLFKSYQALGGHRAGHKKVNTAEPPPVVASAAAGSGGGGVEKIHECPFCQRVFSSGQALGGHKRSHFLGSGNPSTTNSSINDNIIINSPVKKNSRICEIDLNLPAPVDEDDEIAVSAVSDAEFVQPMKQL